MHSSSNLESESESDESSVVSESSSNSPSNSSGNESDDCKVVAGNQDDETSFLKASITKCLDEAETTGSFACFNAVNAPLPGLLVKQVGDIGLPLTTRDAKAIIKVSRQSAFGKGTKTIVDKSVRNCWELNPADFELTNPAWKGQVQKILDSVVDTLGVSCDASAHLYKLLLYEKGAFFRRHQDSEKEDRMFGTLVIALPSKHSGGEVYLSHAGQTKVFDSSKTSPFEFSYAAWFSDVTHEVKPVKEGYRLVLTYNLARPSEGSPQSAAILGDKTQRLRSILARSSTKANLRLDLLKGDDQLKTRYFKDSCAEEGFTVYLANIVKEVHGGVEDEGYGGYYGGGGDHEIQDITDESLELSHVMKLDGTVVIESMDFDEEDIVQNDIFKDREPDEEDFEGYTGNEGSYATHWYRDTLVIILPDSYNTTFVFQGVKKDEARISSWIDRLLNSVRVSSSKEEELDLLKDLCSLVCETQVWNSIDKRSYSYSEHQKPYSDDLLTKVASVCLELGFKEGFIQGLAGIRKLNSTKILAVTGKAIATMGLTELENGVNTALQKLTHLHQKYSAVQELGLHYETAAREAGETKGLQAFKKWQSHKIDELINSPSLLVKADSAPLTAIFERDTSKERRFRDDFPYSIVRVSEEGFVTKAIVSRTYKEVLKDAIPKFKIALPGSTNKRQKTDYPLTYNPNARREVHSPESIDTTATLNAEDLMQLILQCESMRITCPVEQIITALSDQVTAEPSQTLFHSIYLPFLARLLSHFSSFNLKSDFESSPYPSFVRTTLCSYLYSHVGKEPAPPPDWSLPIINSCGCQDCTALNDFLRHPSQQTVEFKTAGPGRKHLEQKIYCADVSTETIRDRTPYTLKITKARKAYRRTHDSWKLRRKDAETRVRDLENTAPALFKKLLGDMYDTVRGLKVELLEEGGIWKGEQEMKGTDASALKPLSRNRKRPAAALEEKTEASSGRAEVVDLT